MLQAVFVEDRWQPWDTRPAFAGLALDHITGSYSRPPGFRAFSRSARSHSSPASTNSTIAPAWSFKTVVRLTYSPLC
jgi:hypothetical protein